jgi:hypothetical protein
MQAWEFKNKTPAIIYAVVQKPIIIQTIRLNRLQ